MHLPPIFLILVHSSNTLLPPRLFLCYLLRLIGLAGVALAKERWISDVKGYSGGDVCSYAVPKTEEEFSSLFLPALFAAPKMKHPISWFSVTGKAPDPVGRKTNCACERWRLSLASSREALAL